MTISTSRLAYLDCFKVLDKALEDKQGARIRMTDMDSAIYFRMRCHQARSIERKENLAVYDEGEFMHGKSVYDRLVLRIKTEEGVVYLYLEKALVDMGDVEALANEPDQEMLEAPKPQLRIEGPKPEPEPVTITVPVLRRI